MSESKVLLEARSQETKTIVKKSDWFFYYLFWPFFLLPKSFTPNHVSFLRLFICLPLCLLMFLEFFKTAGAVFILAALMDGLDGSMARMRNQTSSLGTILDPTADKALNMTVFISFLFYIKDSSYPWLIMPIIIIDLLLFFTAISKYAIKDYLPNLPEKHLLRNWLEPQKILAAIQVEKTGANHWGKTKMVIQIIVLSAMLLFNPNAGYFIHPQINLPLNLIMLDFFLPLLLSCIVFGFLSLWGHLKVVHFTTD